MESEALESRTACGLVRGRNEREAKLRRVSTSVAPASAQPDLSVDDAHWSQRATRSASQQRPVEAKTCLSSCPFPVENGERVGGSGWRKEGGSERTNEISPPHGSTTCGVSSLLGVVGAEEGSVAQQEVARPHAAREGFTGRIPLNTACQTLGLVKRGVACTTQIFAPADRGRSYIPMARSSTRYRRS